ncbi:FAD-dependent tricarballylate dehydrogenase TcuA [Modestobacter sp. VKM Ac-2979]|uniref:FAD-dependent tricarballylate dehydrogenase TcuA n=1 Tax=unclassified Modestobacter TaxID=2643866 RepID=UPI0022ABA3FD|nr:MULTISPECIES: FAD-dependent tricarballylate dehydrogenase TcuA [unclassified Modestobacter]MCZ2813945.1 FAD-dependent tricarballylate dehydrogenase TcuA [Modestobacter sp. VKM Ac-2979]MCZ2844640.1 FAD-dependent tricarballylate dehydrogenase TcuA [Modestobacter sp. VKM Ac-2980]
MSDQSTTTADSYDVIVVGGGNAGFSAAHAAALRGRRVLLLEKAAMGLAGGNSYYTAGATRISHGGLEDILQFVEPDSRHDRTRVPPYSAEEYAADLAKVTGGRNDPALTQILVTEGQQTVRWLQSLGLRYRLMYERQAYERADGSYLFWGGLHVGNVDGGEGLIRDHTRVAGELGIEVRYQVAATGLVVEGGRVAGVKVRVDGKESTLSAESIVLAAGGFEANAEMRRQHLGEGWENAKVRGTPCNTGEMIQAALAVGAARGGDWGSAHSVQWDAECVNNESNRELTNRLTRQSYPLGILVNRDGERFVDEGADFRNYTYAKYGKVILQQSGSVAYQVFDANLRPMLRTEEYDMPGISVVAADRIEDLAARLNVPVGAFLRTVEEFNAAIDHAVPLDPTVLDGRRADVSPPKSNWASPIETGPFYAYPVTCGITFTFGGLKGDTNGRVLDDNGEVIPGLFVCGEMLGGLFSDNYPGGSGLTAGMVFGRRAGEVV